MPPPMTPPPSTPMRLISTGSAVTMTSPGRVLHPLDDRARAQAAAAAHGDEGVGAVDALQLVQSGGDQAGPGAPDRVAQSDGAAVGVHLLHVRMELALPSQDNR